MKKSDFIYLLSKNLKDYNETDVNISANLIQKAIIESLKKRNRIEIRGFGTISRKIDKEKFVRNPKTNEKLFKNQSYKLHFKIGKLLHKKININNGDKRIIINRAKRISRFLLRNS